MGLANVIAEHGLADRSGPLWKGPQQDGITFSLLSKFLACRERFRILAIEGLAPPERWNHRLGYGNMWHTCEQALSAYFADEYDPRCVEDAWQQALEQHYSDMARKWPLQQKEIHHWYNVCRAQFPVYVDYWQHHPDNHKRKPIFQEQEFAETYLLPSDRLIKLRGKWDAVDVIYDDDQRWKVYLQENKTKGDVDAYTLPGGSGEDDNSTSFVDSSLQAARLAGDLQTMFYLTALTSHQMRQKPHLSKAPGVYHNTPLGGVRYNVVRRPLSGGRHTIRPHKPTKKNPAGESMEEYYERLGECIASDPDYFFFRWKVEISHKDLRRFQTITLEPILEQLCDWWECLTTCAPDPLFFFRCKKHGSIHWQHPLGLYNALDEGGSTPYDAYLATGSEIGLTRATTLFPELQGG